MNDEQLTSEDRQHIADVINNGCDSGDLSGENYRGSWELTFEKFED